MNINYADAILQLRAKLNMSQQEIAKYLGVSFASISRWERGLYEPTKLIKVKLIKMLEENCIDVKEVTVNEISRK